MPIGRGKALAAKFLLVAGGLAAATLLAELLVRWVAPQSVLLVGRGLYEPDPPRGYRLHPGSRAEISNRLEYTTTAHVNAAGLRGTEIGAKSADRPRVLLVGDSFVFGVGVDDGETLPARVEAHLAERGAPSEVLNGGVPGYGVPDEVSWYERWGAPLSPDLVVLTVFVGNDLRDALPGRKPTVVDGLLVMPGFDPGQLGYWLFHHSHLYVALKTSPLGAAARRLLGRPSPMEHAEVALELQVAALGEPGEIERVGGGATEEALRRLVAALPAGRLAVVVLPSQIQVDPEAWRRALAEHQLDPARYDAARPTRWFLDLCARHGVPAFDLTAPLSAALARGERIYYRMDPHLTAAGNDLAADDVARFVAERLAASSR